MTSLVSVGSNVSVFSNAIHADLESCKAYRKAIIQIREEEEHIFKLIDAEVESMLEQYKIQKNVGIAIKDGLKRVKACKDQLKKNI